MTIQQVRLGALALLLTVLAVGLTATAGALPLSATHAVDLTKVPNVKGLTPEQAKKQLRKHNLKAQFTKLTNVCAGKPPEGRIVAQKPRGGYLTHRYSTVKLQTSCSGRG